jgi:pimeloyl-ACP methyl ester carboxylesterase
MPLVIISRSKPVALPPSVPTSFSPDAFEKAWQQGQDRLARLEPDARHLVAEKSDHYVQISQPQPVVEAIRPVVDAMRDPSSWQTRALAPN